MTYRCGWWSRWLAWLWSWSLSVLWDTHEDVWEADQRRTICAEQPSGNPHHQLLWATSEQSTAIRWAHSSLDYALCSEFIKWMCAVCCTMEFQMKCCTEKAFAFKCIFLDSFLKYIFCFLKKTVKRLIIMCLRLLGLIKVRSCNLVFRSLPLKCLRKQKSMRHVFTTKQSSVVYQLKFN